MKKSILFVCAALTLLAACKSSPKETAKQDDNAFIVLSEDEVSGKKTVKLSELTEDFRIIRFDNRDEALFKLNLPHFSDNYICIYQGAQKVVKLFDKDGKFICDVGAVGQGPEEYFFIYDAAIDEKNGFIYIAPFANNNKIQKYDLKGAYAGTITLKGDINKGRLSVQPDGTLAMVQLCFHDNGGDHTGALIPLDSTQSVQYSFYPSLASSFRDASGMNVGFNNEIWSWGNAPGFPVQYTNNDTLYHYDTAANQLVPRFLYAMNPEKRKNSWFMSVELPNHFLIRVNSDKSCLVLMDKATGEASEVEFINDFMGNMPISPWFQGGYYFICYEPLQLQERIEKALASGDCPEDQVEKLTKLKNSIHENDNNIMFVAKLKQ